MTDQGKLSKKFHLTDEETKNLRGREMAIDYILDLIKRDINMYLYMDIVPRLGLDQNGKYTLSKDRTWLEVTEAEGAEERSESKIIIPEGVKK